MTLHDAGLDNLMREARNPQGVALSGQCVGASPWLFIGRVRFRFTLAKRAPPGH